MKLITFTLGGRAAGARYPRRRRGGRRWPRTLRCRRRWPISSRSARKGLERAASLQATASRHPGRRRAPAGPDPAAQQRDVRREELRRACAGVQQQRLRRVGETSCACGPGDLHQGAVVAHRTRRRGAGQRRPHRHKRLRGRARSRARRGYIRTPGCVYGYTIVNDVTIRELQKRHVQFFIGKSAATYCPMGPVLVTADEIADVGALRVQTRINGELRQDAAGNGSDLRRSHSSSRPSPRRCALRRATSSRPGHPLASGSASRRRSFWHPATTWRSPSTASARWPIPCSDGRSGQLIAVPCSSSMRVVTPVARTVRVASIEA